MIFSQYIETCEVMLYYPKIGGNDIEDYAKNSIRNLLHANIDAHSRRLIAELPMERKNALKNCNHIVQTRLFLTKVDMTGLFKRSHMKEGNMQ